MGGLFLRFWKKSCYLAKSPILMKKWKLLNKQSLLFFFSGCAFLKRSLTLTNHTTKSIWRSQIEITVLWLWKAQIQNWNFRSKFCFLHLTVYVYTRSGMKSIARRLFTSEFKSFHDSAVSVKLEVRGGIKRQFPLFIFINIMMLKGDFFYL